MGLDNTALEHLKRSAAETFEAAKKASEENLKSALTQKVMMDLHLDLRAPVILVPETVTRAPHTHMEEGLSDAVMVVQPGNLSVWSLKAQHLSKVSRLLCGKNMCSLRFPLLDCPWSPSLCLDCVCQHACSSKWTAYCGASRRLRVLGSNGGGRLGGSTLLQLSPR